MQFRIRLVMLIIRPTRSHPTRPHMRRVGWVEYPGAALSIQVVFHIVEAWICPDHLQLKGSGSEISLAVGTDLFRWAPDCEEPPKGIDEVAGTHGLYHLNVNCP